MHIHYFQHVSFEGLGYIAEWLKTNNHTVTFTHFFEPEYSLPAVDEIDALILMGGPMSVYDEPEYAWLKQEKEFIKQCIKSNKKLLGICLGAQLIADCLGAKIVAATHKEIGWFQLQTTNECENIDWLYHLVKDNPTVFHWHGEQFEIPANALNCLSSKANCNQAFLLGSNIIALQFHLEVTKDALQNMLDHGANELNEDTFVQSTENIKLSIGNIHTCNKIMSVILAKWLQ